MTKVCVVWKRYHFEEMADYVQSLLSTEITVVRVWSVQHEVEVSAQWFKKHAHLSLVLSENCFIVDG